MGTSTKATPVTPTVRAEFLMGGLRLRRTKEGTLVDQYSREWRQEVNGDKWDLKYMGIRDRKKR